MGAEAKKYLEDHSIPQLFEGLMTGLVYNKPNDPIEFLEGALSKVRKNPGMSLRWDTFVDDAEPVSTAHAETATTDTGQKRTKKTKKGAEDGAAGSKEEQKKSAPHTSKSRDSVSGEDMNKRRPSVTKAALHAAINPDAPIILFMGGPGGGKTRYAAKVRDSLEDKGLVLICVPDLIKDAIKRYKDRYPEWKEAATRYERGELISNDLAQTLVKAEMGRYPNAKAYFLEGFPREAKQVEDFERNVRSVNMAMILDYDEETLRKHMQNRGLDSEVIDRRINEFRSKTLPSAKYFDDHRLLHLIPGEKDDSVIFERMKRLVSRAMASGVPVLASHPAASPQAEAMQSSRRGSRTSGPTSPPNDAPPSLESVRSNQPGSPKDFKAASPASKPPSQSATPTNSRPATRSLSQTARSVQSPKATPPKSQTATEPAVEPPLSRVVQTPKTATPPKVDNGTKEVKEESAANNKAPPETAQSVKSVAERVEPMEAKESKPPTPASQAQTVSRPPTNGSKPSGDAESKPGTAQQNGTRPPSSVASTPKPAEDNKRDQRTESASTASRMATAADRFPKGLPNNAPVILIIGAPGSNKVDIAEKVARKYDGFVHVSMGDLLRKKVRDNPQDDLWSRVGKKVDNGEHIPMLLYSTVHDLGARSWGYVIEGYPRTLAQAEDIESQLGRLDMAILLDCTEQYCKDNIKRRAEEAKENNQARPDDQEQPMKQRLALFKQNTLPMLKHLDDKGKLRVIEGDAPTEKLFKEVLQVLDPIIAANDKTQIPTIQSNGHTVQSAGSVAS